MGFVHYSSVTSRQVILLTCLFLSLTGAAEAAQAPESWHAVSGPDGDFTVEFPAPPASEITVSEQLPFVRQKMFSYSYNVDEAYLFDFNYKDLTARAASIDRQQSPHGVRARAIPRRVERRQPGETA